MRLVVVLLLAPVVACDPEPEPVPPHTEARVELAGSTPDGLVVMTDGGTVPLVLGPQGGYHLDVGVRIFAIDPEGARLGYEVWDTDGSRSFHADAVFALRRERVRDAGDHYERAGDRAFLDIAEPNEISGRTVDVSAIFEASDGARYEDVRTVTVVSSISPP